MIPARIGVVGCGAISGIYKENLARFRTTEIVAAADLDPQKAVEFGAGEPMTVEQLLATPEVDVVLNLTVPGAHFEVSLEAVRAGKSVYNEKPLCLTTTHAHQLLREAATAGVSTGCAPDTFLGASHQTCRRLIDEGEFGRVIGGTAFMMCAGHESWHPSPAFYYQAGGGPLFDMGPYYITALVNMLGPVRAVTGMHEMSYATRTITSRPRSGEVIPVEVPTHIVGTLRFESGAIVSLITSFDVVRHTHNHIELYGSEGSLQVPDPNGFGGVPKVATRSKPDWTDVPVTGPFAENSRGIGLAQMVFARSQGIPALASGDLAAHVLEVMEGIIRSGDEEREIAISNLAEKPAPLDIGVEY